MTTDLEKLNLIDVQAAVSCYRNLFYHRTVILEGIRKIAFRNMVHLVDAIESCKSHPSPDNEDWMASVQKKMLEDQRLEDDALNRILIGWATFYPLQVYLALLYAEIEYFHKHCGSVALLSDNALPGYLDERIKFITKLKRFRDFYLHPRKENTLSESDFLNQDGASYNLVPDLQKAFDAYLVRTRLKLWDLLKHELFDLPDIQRMFCISRSLQLNGERMELHHDSHGMEHVTGQIEKFSEEMNKIPDEVRSWSPSPRQRKVAGILAECLNEVTPSGPEQQYMALPAKQTPMSFHLLSELLFGEQPPQSYGNSRHATHFAENKVLYKRIIITSGVLLNEAVTDRGMYSLDQLREFAQAKPSSEFQDVYLNTVQEQGLQHANEMVSPSRVSVALLYEPLRIYAQVREESGSTSIQLLDNFVTPERLKKLADYRNSVFHVLKPSKHPLKTDLAVTDPGLCGDALELYDGLSKFYAD